jgi:putative ABC transport system permease protein
MWRYVFLMLRRQPGKSALASSGFLLAACALILLSATTQTTVVQANEIISQSWRSSYDLVVLPPQAQIVSKETIPADLLEAYDGGISIQQYQQIKSLPGVEVAAPIAFVGYAQMPVPQLEFFTQPLPSGYYRIDLALTAFNGQRQIVERSASMIYYHLSTCTSTPSQNILNALDKKGISFECGTDPILWLTPPPPMDTGTFLLAAIDPAAENQLVHLDKNITSGRMLTSQDNLYFDTNPNLVNALNCPNEHSDPSQCSKVPNYDIPVLFHMQLPGQIALKGTFTHMAPGTLDPQTVLAEGGAAYLTQLPDQQTLFGGIIPLVQNDPQRFSGTMLALNGHSWQPYTLKGGGIDPVSASLKFLYTPSGLTYQPAIAPDGQANVAYALVPSGLQAPEAAFRELYTLHIAERSKPLKPYPLPTAFYYLDAVGQFTGDTLDAQFSNPLNWLPEKTYTSPPTVLRYDAQGKPVPPVNLLPTTNPAGFILQPPLAITTLAAAERLRGDHIISAIRIRVSGVEAANPASWKRVQQVAAMIEQRTGLHALVTLGSSPRPTLVYVPGVKQGQYGAKQNIDPIGWVEERWIAIGASILYLAQLGSTRLLLLGTVLGACLGYLVVAFSALVASQRREFAVLSALGWRPWQPARLFLSQALLLALGGGIVGLGVALLIAALLEAIPIWLIVVWTLPVMLVMALLSSLYPLWQIWRIRPAEILRASSSISSPRAPLLGLRLWSFIAPIEALVLRNLARSRPRTLMTIGSLFLSAVLLVLMFSSILALRQTLTGTLLGDFVLLQTAVPQIAGCVFAVLLSFLSVADLLLLQVRERQQEIGLLQAVGWRPRLVQRLFVQEGLTLAILSTLPGVLVAQWILSMQHTIQHILPAPLLALSVILLMMLVAVLASIPALRAMNRMQVVDVLRAE